MDFEQYLEQDILKFLDGKIQKEETANIDREEEYGLYITRDYLKELNYALDNDELTRAKKLFDELKRSYSKLPKSSFERKKIYTLLEKMYAKIQNYVEIKEGKVEVIKQGETEVLKSRSQKFSNTIESKKDNKVGTEAEDKWDLDNLKNTSVPISLGSRTDSDKKTESGNDNKKNIPIDSNIFGRKTDEDQAKKDGAKKGTATDDDEKTDKSSSSNKTSRRILLETSQEKYDESEEVEEMEEEILEEATNVEKLKMRVIEKLMNELRAIIDEKSQEQNRKIDALRAEIIQQVNSEVGKKLSETQDESTSNATRIRGEILNQVYNQAGEIVSSIDNDKDSADALHNTKVSKKHSLGSINYSSDDLRVVYEQAIYYMFDNKYDEAAKLFKKIISVQPMNKAARIRLQECMENHPELAREYSDINKTLLYSSEKKAISKDMRNRINPDFGEGIEDLEEALKNIDITIEDANREKPISHETDRRMYVDVNEGELKKVYEQGIYTMFQNNYAEAAEMFRHILRIRPANKAAKIRLRECLEAINNA
jgi:tetratricopeptide (TPR) repeat protein